MKAERFCSAAILLVALTGSGDAAENAYQSCINRTTANVDWGQCGQQEIDRQEVRLNAAWRKAIDCFDASTQTGRDAKQAFLDEQRSWIKWKDSACSFYFPRNSQDDSNGFAGREGQVLGAPQCKITIISDREKWLDGFAKDCQ